MLDSQALETAIGLTLMFFIFSSAASAVTEVISARLAKRSTDLKAALVDMLDSGDLPDEVRDALPAQVEKLLARATGKTSASYLSAKSFADAATELVAKGEHIGVLQTKLKDLAREARGELDTVKSGLETWFDQSMAQAQDLYSRWASMVLFLAGLVLVVTLNASMINVGQDLWRDSAARDAVLDASGSAEGVVVKCEGLDTDVAQAECAVDNISVFQLPIGWSDSQRDGWAESSSTGVWWWLTHIVGWLLTALLLMLGAPFWFDLLGKLVNLRVGGPRPKPAPDDDTSYSTKVIKDPPTPPDNDQRVPVARLVYENYADAGGGSGITAQQLSELGLAARVNLLRDAPAIVFRPPPDTDAQDVDWLATALNLGVPMRTVNERAEVQRATQAQT